MTNTSPITTTNFIAGTIGVGIALLIMPQIIMGTVGAQQQGVARSGTNSLVEDISSVCGDSDEESGSIDIQDGYTLTLQEDDWVMEDPQEEEIERRKMACNVDTQTELDSSWEEYTVEADDDNYDISQGG